MKSLALEWSSVGFGSFGCFDLLLLGGGLPLSINDWTCKIAVSDVCISAIHKFSYTFTLSLLKVYL